MAEEQATDIVHCKDCRYAQHNVFLARGEVFCGILNRSRKFTWYCADGKKEDDDIRRDE